LKDFNERYAALSTSLGALLEKKSFGLPISDSDLAATWTSVTTPKLMSCLAIHWCQCGRTCWHDFRGRHRIRILGRDQDSVYRVEAQTDDGSFFSDQMQLAEPEKASLAACETDNRKYGARLAQLLFTPKILDAYLQTRGRAMQQAVGAFGLGCGYRATVANCTSMRGSGCF